MAQPMLLEGHSPDDTRSRERDLIQENQRLRSQLDEALNRLRQSGREYGVLRIENERLASSMLALRTILEPLHNALRGIFGELPAVESAIASAQDPRKAQVWEAWKQRIGGLPAKAIDALLLHGELSRTQLRIHLGCATGSIPDIVYKLNQAGLITKNGSKIALKEL